MKSPNVSGLPKTKICPTCSNELAGVEQPISNFYFWFVKGRGRYCVSKICKKCKKKLQKQRNKACRKHNRELWADKILQQVRKHYSLKNTTLDDRLTPLIIYRLFNKQKGLCALTGVSLLIPSTAILQQESYSSWYKKLSKEDKARTIFLVGVFKTNHLEIGKIVLIAKGALGYYDLCEGITRKVDTPKVFSYRDLRK